MHATWRVGGFALDWQSISLITLIGSYWCMALINQKEKLVTFKTWPTQYKKVWEKINRDSLLGKSWRCLHRVQRGAPAPLFDPRTQQKALLLCFANSVVPSTYPVNRTFGRADEGMCVKAPALVPDQTCRSALCCCLRAVGVSLSPCEGVAGWYMAKGGSRIRRKSFLCDSTRLNWEY